MSLAAMTANMNYNKLTKEKLIELLEKKDTEVNSLTKRIAELENRDCERFEDLERASYKQEQ